MIIKEDIEFVKQTFEKYGIRDLLGLKGKYYDDFVDLVCWSYRNTDSEVWVNSKFQRVSNYYIKILIVLGGAFVSSIKFLLKYGKFKTRLIKSTIIAVPFCGAHVRYKYIHDLVDDVTLCYPPIFHYQYLDTHINCFKKQGHNIHIDRFDFSDILNVCFVIFRNERRLKRCHYDIDNYFEKDYGYFISVLITSLLYKKYIIRFQNKIAADTISIKWLFDYDFDYKYIIFNNEIKKQRPSDVTFHVQHGAFFGYEDAYCNPVSDINLCCSPREKVIIENYNKYHSRIFPLGSSLQSIDKSEDNNILASFDVLVLLTDTVIAETTDFQIKLLKDLSKRSIDVLVRYRPQSAQIDKKVLSGYTHGMKISAGTTLKNDILSAKMVVCFSEDAVYECIRNHKRVVYMVCDTSFYNFTNAESSQMHIFSPESFDNSVFNRNFEYDIIDYSTDEFVRYNFGDFEFEKLKMKLNNIINQN